MTTIIMLTSTTAVLLACLGFVVAGLVSMRNRHAGDLSTLAQVVGANSTAALTFGDRQSASEVLSALQARPSIVAAAIYSERGQPFAHYRPNRAYFIPTLPDSDGFHDRGNRLELFYGIQLGGQRIGTLYIASDLRDRNVLLQQYGLIAAGIVLVSLLSAFVLSSRLQRNISSPIIELARVARLVSQDKDYSVRADPESVHDDGDEIGRLIAGFNGMLIEIEQRDHRLLVAKSEAERISGINAQLARESALILNTVTDGIIGVDLDTEPSFINPAAARMLGRSLSDLRGRSIHKLIHHSSADGVPLPEDDCPLGLALLRGESFTVTDDTFWREDGSSFPVEYSGTAMVDDRGNKRGAVITFRDITERRAIERLKGEFVSTVSHELRTPLTSIRGALGLLGSGLLGSLEERGQRMLEIAIKNTDRLVRLINEILDLERIGSGTVEMTQGSVDARAVMLQAVEGLQAMASEAGVQLVVEPATATLVGDSDRIIQALTNLLGNAVKFSPAGTTTTLSGLAGELEFIFCVADQGRGVPEEKLESIFDRFSQVDASDSRVTGGTGLGLAICRSIVSAHRGRIWAEPNEPSGTRFQFTIPLAAAAVETPATGAINPLDDTPFILLVEGDVDLARVMAAALQNHGFRTVHAVTGCEAVRLLHQREPQLVVLDLALPDMQGFEVVHSLRATPSLGSLPMIVYSALDVAVSDQPRLTLGPTLFLTKSRCSLPDFVEHLTRMLDAA
jgi:PAS domain S-box-containing protein